MLQEVNYDVTIVGGGASGIAAAVASARSGARVALIENHAFLGGKATAAVVGTVCGFYLRNEDHTLHFATNGFAREFEEQLKTGSNTQPQCNTNGLWYLPYKPFEFGRLCDTLIRHHKIDLYLHTVLFEVVQDQKKISALKCLSYDRLIQINTGAVVDCSGEAMVSKLAGAPVEENNEYQASAQVFYMESVTPTDPALLNLLLIREIRKAIDSGILEEVNSHISILPGSVKNTSVGLKIGIPERITNDYNKISLVELRSREIVGIVAAFLTRYIKPFSKAYVASIASEVGVRTGRKSIGKQYLTKMEVLSSTHFDDGIANGAWPIEYWGFGKRVKMEYFAVDSYYQIPAGCLCSADLENLYFGGRHISADQEAIASARVIGTCLATGYAAGKLASGSLEGKALSESIKLIRSEQVIL